MTSRPSGAPDDGALAEAIAAGAAELGSSLAPAQVDMLVRYLRLVERWNGTYNLTAVRGPRDMVVQHVVDCLAAAGALARHRDLATTQRLLDVGSGAGFPGLVFAIVFPSLAVTCVDAVGKKAAFMTQVVAALQLRNAVGLHVRVESMSGAYDVVASRAFAPLSDFVAATGHLLADNAEWMAMKGKTPRAEMAAVPGVRIVVEPVVVPGLAAERCIVWMRPSTSKHTLSG